MVIDKERIAKILSDLDRYFKDLEALSIHTMQDLQDPRNFYSVSMLLFSLLNRSIDLGDELVTSLRLGMPEKYRDIFELLYKEKIIDRSLYNNFVELIRLRNLIAHEYQMFTEKDIFPGIQKVKEVRAFMDIVKKKVKSS